MFLVFWKSILKSKAAKFNFLIEGHSLAEEIPLEYVRLKEHLKKIQQNLFYLEEPNGERSLLIMKEFLKFYQSSETLLLNLLNEIFNNTFEKHIMKKMEIFQILNKVLKLFMALDLILIKNPEIFCNFCEFRLLSPKKVYNCIEEQEYDMLSVLGMIYLPMGRMFISMFSSDSFDLEIPVVLSKRSKIYLNTDRQKKICLYGFLAFKYKLQYLSVYLGIIYKKLFKEDLEGIEGETNGKYIEYINMLNRHL